MPPLPLTNESQTAFAAYLAQSVSAATVRSYLAAVGFYQIRAGLADPSLNSPPRLPYVLKGIQRSHRSQSYTRGKRLPVTPELLMKIHTSWSQSPLTYDKIMLWAAFSMGFFGFLRSGEFTHSPSQPHSECALMTGDVSIDSRDNPQVLTVRLRKSKTDPYGSGTYIHMGRTGTQLCPVSAVLAYLAIRPPTEGPLFIFNNGTPLSRNQLVRHLREALSQIGVDVNKYSGHSFRIGAATTAAAAGLSDSFIQTLGRWKSSAFTAYIRTPVEDLAAASAMIATQCRSTSEP